MLFMVLYHWLNYFVGTYAVNTMITFKFLTPSFIFITGFMISQIQLRRYENSQGTCPNAYSLGGLSF